MTWTPLHAMAGLDLSQPYKVAVTTADGKAFECERLAEKPKPTT